ncbi:MAG: oligosaccharide flippase family protein [Nanoarchaeota archaeon]
MLKKIAKSAFVKDNVILFIGSFLAGILGFLYHALMGRLLGVVDYGILGTLLAGFYFFNASLVNTLQTSIAKFTATLAAKKEDGKVRYLIERTTRLLSIGGILLLIIYALFIPWTAEYLHIEKKLVFITGFLFLVILLVAIGRGVMQGVQDFKNLSVNYIVEGVAKLLLAMLAVYLGHRVGGAIVALILAYVIIIAFFWMPIKRFFRKETVPAKTRGICIYSIPVFCMIVSLTLFFSADVILVKHFFSETEAGIYSALSLLGKIIFFGTLSIAQVMFPKVSANHSQGKSSVHLFYYSLLVIVICIGIALSVYLFFPQVLVSILFGNAFAAMIPLVGKIGIFMSLISILYLMSFYLISLDKFLFIMLLFCANITQIVLVYMYHTSLAQIIMLFNIVIVSVIVVLFIMHIPLFVPSKKVI